MKTKKTILLLIILACIGICIGAAITSSPYDGTGWNTGAPNNEALVGNAYQEVQDLRKGVGIRMDKEHVTAASSSAGGEHKQGSARAFFQDTAPTTQLDGGAWIAGDTGSLWFDTNSTPDNIVYVLTNHASTGTWTLLSVSMIAEIVAAAHQWADVQTFDVQTVHTLGILSNADITLGAADDLVGSATSAINMNAFDVDENGVGTIGTSFNIASTVVVVGTIDDDTMGTATDTTLATSESVKAYADAQNVSHAGQIKGWANLNGEDGTNNASYNVTSTVRSAEGIYVITWDTDFASADYCVTFGQFHAGNLQNVRITAQAAGSVTVETNNKTTSNDEDCTELNVMAIGAQ